jgi:bifunctional UDP-N-acetylglucosamine pyrophosphorylase/glucosamine-1-phosphate N-acetyltransferase
MVHIVILAAGKGTRMQSEIPKVLHPVKGVPIIQRLLKTVTKIDPKPTLIIGHKAQEIIDATGGMFHYVEQKEQLGTGHAVQSAKEGIKVLGASTIVVLPGDHPLISAQTIQNLIDEHSNSKAVVTLCTAVVDPENPYANLFTSYGRIIRNENGDVEKIVEYKDATLELKAINEYNLSYYCFDAKWLWENIDHLGNNNAQKEFYLTDMIQMAKDQGLKISSVQVENLVETFGINSRDQLKIVEDSLALAYNHSELDSTIK